MTRQLWFLAPEAIDDPERVSGGNVYDQQLRDGLRRRGWEVRMLTVAGPDEVPAALATAPREALVLVDGLVAGWAPEAMAAASGIRLIVLAHMVSAAFPDADEATCDAERRALRAAEHVIATSEWTAGELIRRRLADERRVSVARPGVLGAAQPALAASGRALLCVGAVAPHKAQDVLLAALGRLADLDWSCTLAGSLTADRAYAGRIAQAAARFGGRVRMPGVLGRSALDDAYRRAGLVVAPSRVESYGIAIADARHRGIPVIASDTGGIREAVAGGGAVLLPVGDPEVLAHALWRWLADPALRGRLRADAARGREGAPRWADTVAHVDRILVTA